MARPVFGTDQQRPLLSGNPFDVNTYSPYGFIAAAAVPALAFCGQYRDPLTGGYPLGNGHRVYSPSLGRFIGPDALSPFGKGGLNAYAYCQGDPVNFIDPSGRFPAIMAPIRNIVTGVINLAISAVKAYRNYRIERDFALNSGYPASRSGIVTFNTAEQPVAPWTMQDKVLSAAGAISASVSIGTATGRLFTPAAEGLAWVDFGVASVATALSAYELYGLATSSAERRYPIQPMAYQVRTGAQWPETAV
ncbi:RHS repeat-associated core domain-containing protein [Pseudomonas sp. NPDC089407]|uniref:RHS repeat-associated core domain-containing protein n=1 Tax=Pseudomonas sp. NPDC089407 TaxID=3364464 RepID=UPI00384E37CF